MNVINHYGDEIRVGDERMGHLSLRYEGVFLILETDTKLDILDEWCRRFHGEVKEAEELTQYVCERTDESALHAIVLAQTPEEPDPYNSLEAYDILSSYPPSAVKQLRFFDRYSDVVKYFDGKVDVSARRQFGHHRIYERLQIVHCLEGLFEVFAEFRRLNRFVIWRGHERIGYELTSSIARKYRNQIILSPSSSPFEQRPEEYVRSVEQTQLDDMAARGHNIRNGAELSDLELLSLIQHQRGATRLLDFSWNVMVAIWFACYAPEHRERTGLLFGIVLDPTKQDRFRVLRSPTQYKLPIAQLVDSNPNSLMVWQPVYHNPRMFVQQSVFAFSRIGVTHRPRGATLVLPDYPQYFDDPSDDPTYIQIGLSPDFKKDVNSRWGWISGFTQSRIFPDFEGFAQNWTYNNYVPE